MLAGLLNAIIVVELLVVVVVIFANIVQYVKHCNYSTISMKMNHMSMRDCEEKKEE